MSEKEILYKIGLERAVSTHLTDDISAENQSVVLDSARDFGVDRVYFNTDENSNSFPAVFLKKVNAFDIKTLEAIAETQRKIWNFKKVLFLYVYSEVEIRIYDCSDKPLVKTQKDFDYEGELKKLEIKRYVLSDKAHLEELNKLFSAIAIDTGIIWTLEEAEFIRKKITLQKRVDKYLIDSLVNTADQLANQGLAVDYIHKIILRSLFLLYLEDRGATDAQFYSQIKKDSKSYFDILDDVDATFDLFQKLEEHFNGNVFTLEKNENITTEQLQLIKKCFISGNDSTPQISLFEDWRIFDFSIIQIELLSEIYENFLFKTDPELKKKTGTYYTPPSLVEFILNEKLPVNNGETEYNVKILDPSCGSGIFLVESFRRLVKRYENHHGHKLTDFETLKKLLTDNIYGIELHPQAIKVAAFSLYLALVDNLNPRNIWQDKKHDLPNLINNPNDTSLKAQGANLFCRDTIGNNSDVEKIQFDLVVGNPPFGTSDLSTSIMNYCKKFNFAKEMVLPFLHKATLFAPNGQIALIFNTKVLTNTGGTYQNFRKWLFNDCYVEKVYNFSILRNAKKNFGGQLFGDATGPISIVYYQKEDPGNPSDKIAYYAPKTYIKSNIIEGLNIDFTDLKYLPRTECQKTDTKIWKIAMWGGMNDWNLVQRLNRSKYRNIDSFNKEYGIKSGVGFQLLTQKKDTPKYSEILTRLPYLDANNITQHYTSDIFLDEVKKCIKSPKAIAFYKEFYNVSDIKNISELTAFRRLGDIKAFTNPHIILKKGLEKNNVCASFVEANCSFRDGVYGFYLTDAAHVEKLYLLMSYFNSKLSTYFLFNTISSYGIEREQIMKNEYLSLPLNLNDNQILLLQNASKQIIEILKHKNFLSDSQRDLNIEDYIDENINKIIFESLSLSENDIVQINDCLNFNLDLFHKQEKSKALLPALNNQITEYGKIISLELNEFLEGQELYANLTTYTISKFNPLMLIKISFAETKQELVESNDYVDEELKKIDQFLWEQKATSIYFRKKLNYKTGNDIYIIRPNQRRFWSQSMALEDATELILEILNGN